MTSAVVASGHVVRAVSSFATTIAHYLLPVIRFVGHRDERFEALAKLYPSLVHEKRYSGRDADLTVFDHFPGDLLREPGALDADSAYLFCLEGLDELPDTPPRSLARLTALSLLEPDIDRFLWHVTALLTLKDLSYSNGRAVYPEFLSVAPERRRVLSDIVEAVLALHPLVVSVPNERYRDALIDFLFGAMDEAIAPARVDGKSIDPGLLARDRFNLIDGTTLGDSELGALFGDGHALDAGAPSLIVRVATAPPEASFPERVTVRLLEPLRSEGADEHLLAYLLASWRSHATGECRFYSPGAAKRLLARAEGNLDPLWQAIVTTPADEEVPSDEFTAWLSHYRRLSLDSILDETERTIIELLRERSDTVGAASHACGIPAVTWRKRRRRLSEKSSLIELLAAASRR